MVKQLKKLEKLGDYVPTSRKLVERAFKRWTKK